MVCPRCGAIATSCHGAVLTFPRRSLHCAYRGGAGRSDCPLTPGRLKNLRNAHRPRSSLGLATTTDRFLPNIGPLAAEREQQQLGLKPTFAVNAIGVS